MERYLDPASKVPSKVFGNRVCPSEPKEQVLQFLRSRQDNLRPITNVNAPENAQLVILELKLVVTKNVRRLPSFKAVKGLGRNLTKANIPFVTIKQVEDLKLVLIECPEKVFWA